MSAPLPADERLLDLLSGRATEGLSAADDLELRRLLLDHPELSVDELAMPAAAADLAFARDREADPEPLPAELSQLIRLAADDHLPSDRSTAAPSRRAGLAGWLAAVAMLAVALWVGLAGREPATTLADGRLALLDEPGTLKVAWTTPEDPDYAAVEGDVVWSDRRQQGYLRLRGLPPNDPARAQYQLWIVDPDRDAEPVDGGVFDFPTGAEEVIVPIEAKLEVERPRAFAITLEQPGGVVVSDGPLRVVASVAG